MMMVLMTREIAMEDGDDDEGQDNDQHDAGVDNDSEDGDDHTD